MLGRQKRGWSFKYREMICTATELSGKKYMGKTIGPSLLIECKNVRAEKRGDR